MMSLVEPGAPPPETLVGCKVPVVLPDEITRGVIVEERSLDEVVVHLSLVTPMARSHTYRLGDQVLCRRQRDDFGGGSHWRAVKRLED